MSPCATSMSLPATTVLPMEWRRAGDSRQPEDHGVRVEHVYQVGQGAGGRRWHGPKVSPSATRCHPTAAQ